MQVNQFSPSEGPYFPVLSTDVGFTIGDDPGGEEEPADPTGPTDPGSDGRNGENGQQSEEDSPRVDNLLQFRKKLKSSNNWLN